jgi:hypothetical protein
MLFTHLQFACMIDYSLHRGVGEVAARQGEIDITCPRLIDRIFVSSTSAA